MMFFLESSYLFHYKLRQTIYRFHRCLVRHIPCAAPRLGVIGQICLMASDGLDYQIGNVEGKPDSKVERNIPQLSTQIEIAVLFDTRRIGNDYIGLWWWWWRWWRWRWRRIGMVGMIMVEGCIVVMIMIMVWIMIEDDFGICVDSMITDGFVRVLMV